MKPQRAFGIVTATALAACLAAWMTPQQQHPSTSGVPVDEWSVPVVFSVR
jgi:hypothetical protein